MAYNTQMCFFDITIPFEAKRVRGAKELNLEGIMIFIIIISLILTLALYCCCVVAGSADKEKRENEDDQL